LVRWQRAGVWKRLHRILLNEAATAWPNRSGTRRGRQFVAPRVARGKKTGPNPTDRRKAGSKHHVLTDGHGIPLVAQLTAANRIDITQLLMLV
jgi:transposase